MNCSYDPIYGQVPGNGNTTGAEKADRIEFLENAIAEWERMPAGYRKNQSKPRYLAFKEELELLREQTQLDPPKFTPPPVSYQPDLFYQAKKFWRENQPAATIAAAALGTLILRRLLK